MKSVEFVDLHIPTDFDIPIESILKYAEPQTVHFREVIDKMTVVA